MRRRILWSGRVDLRRTGQLQRFEPGELAWLSEFAVVSSLVISDQRYVTQPLASRRLRPSTMGVRFPMTVIRRQRMLRDSVLNALQPTCADVGSCRGEVD
jgi:hypothetical protein